MEHWSKRTTLSLASRSTSALHSLPISGIQTSAPNSARILSEGPSKWSTCATVIPLTKSNSQQSPKTPYKSIDRRRSTPDGTSNNSGRGRIRNYGNDLNLLMILYLKSVNQIVRLFGWRVVAPGNKMAAEAINKKFKQILDIFLL